MLIFSRSGVVELLRSIVTSFGVVVSGNSILPKNPMDLFIQIYICLFWIIQNKKVLDTCKLRGKAL